MILLGALVISAAAGVLVFEESLTLSRSVGWVLAIAAIWLLSR